ncbi:MAG: hypothetical protein ACTSR2_12460 [Candidatus Hodarchaeales archaeon]
MKTLSFKQRGFCAFRVQKDNFQAGCVLKLGKDLLCYTQDHRPLLYLHGSYFCPELQIKLSETTYNEIEDFVQTILTIQDEENTAINLWVMLTGTSNSRNKAKTELGKDLENISKKVREELEEIVFNMA